MKTTKITIKNLFGIRETTLDGKSVEISGPKGSGKTSVLDAIRYALTNRSDRDYIVHQGADEGEIIIETNTGLSIDRKALPAKSAGTVKVRDGSMLQTRPAEFLAQIFTPLQLDPVKFTQLSRQEKNREILNLIEFQWDMNWIKEQFGEIPQGVDYSKHILEVLNDIQAENGIYFQSRQNINRDIRNKQAFIADIAKDIPSGYDYDRWNNYPSGEKYRELERLREQNSRIERAKAFRSGYDAKLRGLEAQRDMDLAAIDSDIARERASLTGTMERLKAELKATEEKLSGMEQRRHEKADVVQSKYETATAKLEKDMGVAADYAGREPVDTTALSQELDTAEEMRKHLNEYQRMVAMQAELEDLTEQSSEFTRKIELARELPAKILETAKIPVEGLTVENGVPLIRGLPISNLSDGELLELCVDISVSKPGQLQIILVDGAERLDTVITGDKAVAWVTGASASAEVNESLTNTTYDDAVDVDIKYTKGQYEAALKAGEFVFYAEKGKARVLSDINSRTTFGSGVSEDWTSNRVIRVLDGWASDTARIFGQQYLGVETNSETGRSLFKADLVSLGKQYEGIDAISNFLPDDVTVQQGNGKRDVAVFCALQPNDSMEKLYMKVTVN